MMALLTMFLALQVERPHLVQHRKPLSDTLVLSIAADRSSYYVGEPLGLRIGIRNTQDQPIQGYFALEPAAGALEIRYRREGSDFEKLGRPIPGGDLIQRPKTLEGNGQLSYEAVLAVDHIRQRPIFPEPGVYEMRVFYRDMPDDTNSVLASNTIVVQVTLPPDRAALDSFTNDLALIAEFETGHSYAAPETIKAAVRFLDRFPDSPYSRHLHAGLRRALQYKVDRKKASTEERELFQKFQAERVPNQ